MIYSLSVFIGHFPGFRITNLLMWWRTSNTWLPLQLPCPLFIVASDFCLDMTDPDHLHPCRSGTSPGRFECSLYIWRLNRRPRTGEANVDYGLIGRVCSGDRFVTFDCDAVRICLLARRCILHTELELRECDTLSMLLNRRNWGYLIISTVCNAYQSLWGVDKGVFPVYER